MAQTLSDLSFAWSFIDDIIIAAGTWEGHAYHVTTVIERLTVPNLIINPENLNSSVCKSHCYGILSAQRTNVSTHGKS